MQTCIIKLLLKVYVITIVKSKLILHPKYSKKRVGAYLLFLQFSDTSRSNDEEPVHHTAADL